MLLLRLHPYSTAAIYRMVLFCRIVSIGAGNHLSLRTTVYVPYRYHRKRIFIVVLSRESTGWAGLREGAIEGVIHHARVIED
jgi:hypothetical protein